MASSFLPDPFDSYDLYRSWNNGWVVQLVKCISLERLRSYIQVHDPYDSYNSCGSWNNGLRVVHLVKCISFETLRAYIQVHDPYDWYDSRVRVVEQWSTSAFHQYVNIYAVHQLYDSWSTAPLGPHVFRTKNIHCFEKHTALQGSHVLRTKNIHRVLRFQT